MGRQGVSPHAFELPGGVILDFFSFDGIRRPASALPKDVCHLALAVGLTDDVIRFKERFAAAAVPFWLETHDVHVYATDPNGLTMEILAQRDSARHKRPDEDAARRVVEAWVAGRS